MQPLINYGTIAQLVEHRTENPCVPGSNPGGTTKKPDYHCDNQAFFYYGTKYDTPKPF